MSTTHHQDNTTPAPSDEERLRLAGDAGHQRLVAELGDELRATGWQVETFTVPVSSDPHVEALFDVWPAALVAISGGILLEAAFLMGLGGPDPIQLASVFGLVMAAGLLGHWLRTGSLRPTTIAASALSARRGEERAGVPRFVVVTHTDTRPPASSSRLRRYYGPLGWYWLALLWLPLLVMGARPWLARAGPGLLVGLGLLVLIRRIDPWLHAPRPYVGDNRTGIALWRQLARELPAVVEPQAQLELLTLPAPPHRWRDRSALQRLARGTGSPTLLVCLDAPGVGDRLLLNGRSYVQELGLAIARDLWIPMEPAQAGCVEDDCQELSGPDHGTLGLSGQRDRDAIDPRLTAAAALWCRELALRFVQGRAPVAPP